MKINVARNGMLYGLRITLGFKEWEADYKHSIFVITEGKEQAQELAQELADAYDNWENGNVDEEVKEEFDNSIYEYLIGIINDSEIENVFVDFDDVILE